MQHFCTGSQVHVRCLVCDQGSGNRSFTSGLISVDWLKSLTSFSAHAALLHWFTSPYVRRLVFDRESGTADVHTWSVFARPQMHRIHLSEIRYPDTLRPQVTFQVLHQSRPLLMEGSCRQNLLTQLLCSHRMPSSFARLDHNTHITCNSFSGSATCAVSSIPSPVTRMPR